MSESQSVTFVRAMLPTKVELRMLPTAKEPVTNKPVKPGALLRSA